MKRFVTHSFLITFLMLSMLGLQACNKPLTNSGDGAYSTNIDERPDKVTMATQRVLTRMRFQDVTTNTTAINGRITAKDSQENSVSVDVNQAADHCSTVTVRIGQGDEAGSQRIIDMIQKELDHPSDR